MIIITKTSSEIKSFLDELATASCETQVQTQQIAQSLYAHNVFSFEQRLMQGDYADIFISDNSKSPTIANVRQSTKTKKFIISRSQTICLRIYRLHSRQTTQIENILVEPFYPGFQTILTDIYGILREDPRSSSPCSYRYSAEHTYRMMRDLRDRFRAELPQYFSDGRLLIDTFEAFQELIHQLAPDKIRSIFRTKISFILLS